MSKAKGTRAEYKTMRMLEAEGYACTRAAASLGAWDVIAIRRDGVKLVQSKVNAWPGSVEMERLSLFECPDNCTREIWRWDDRARMPRVRVL